MSAALSQSFSAFRVIGHRIAVAATMVGQLLVAIGEAGPRMAQIRKLNETTDEELAERGLTRAGEVHRIFGASFYM